MGVFVWFARLSPAQKAWLLATVLAMGVLVGLGIAVDSLGSREAETVEVSVDMPIHEVALRLGMTPKSLARELGLPLNVPKRKPLTKFKITEDQLADAVTHAMSHRAGMLKYFVFAAIVLGGVVFLVRLGRPDGVESKDRGVWYPRGVYIAFLLAAVVFAGFTLGKSPNPMEGAVKVFKTMVGLYPDMGVKIAAFVFFLVLAVVGNKVICGWACPFGALQELIFSLPILGKLKQKKLPFWFTNTIRAGLFILVLLVLFGIVGGRRGMVLYHGINPFNLFDFHFETASILLTVVVALVLSLFVYRPFCHFICPFGLISWIAERFSICRVRIDQQKCVHCGVCIRACPSQAAKGRVEGKLLPADCFSCARCLNVCPVDAIEYSAREKKREQG